MISIKDILQKVYTAVSGICEATYLQDRPEAVDEKLNNFLVIKINSSLSNKEVGSDGSYGYYDGMMRFDLYVRDKQSRNNPRSFDVNVMDAKLKSLMEALPISSKSLLVSRPEITLNVSDKNGFHITVVTARLTTLSAANS